MNKRADIGLGVLFLVVIIALCLGWLVNQGWKECRVNSDCGADQYCGSDFGCHDYKVITKEVAAPASKSYTAAAWILGISIVLAAIIFRWDSIFGRKRENPSMSHKAENSALFEKDYEGE